jgi:membrane protease YdiL (CAAX protease family)
MTGAMRIAEPFVVALVTTGLVTMISMFVPTSWVAVGVALVFLGATWVMVLRRPDEEVLRYGLGLGGLIAARTEEERSLRSMLRAALGAVAVAALFGVLTFVPFYVGFLRFWHPRHGFSLGMPWTELGSLCAGQLLVIALPEEAFYRGYVQSRLDELLPQRVRILGAELGPSLLVTSLVFALGHLATVHKPARLAVFFPSLLFGFLRARTGGVGAGIVFHAMCNVYSELLGRGFGVY